MNRPAKKKLNFRLHHREWSRAKHTVTCMKIQRNVEIEWRNGQSYLAAPPIVSPPIFNDG